MTGRLVRQMLIKASEAGLEIAGAALLGPAWPVLRAALSPVLDRLSEKLGGADPVGSRKAAEQAADEFEKDQRLQELLRSNLMEGLKPVLVGQERLEAGFQTLSQVVLDNTQALEDIKRSVDGIGDKLDEGVKLSDESAKKIEDAIVERVTVALEVRAFVRPDAEAAGVTAAAPEAWTTEDQLVAQADQAVQAVDQIREGRVDEALESLRSARGVLAQALFETPTDIPLRLRQGYVLKAMAQAYSAAGDEEAADRSLGDAETIFRLVIRDIPADRETQDEIASALNSLGNVLHERGRYAEAVSLYREALRRLPDYAYAWHDLFGALVALADAGDVRTEELDEAWNGLLRTAPGIPGLDPSYLDELRTYHYQRLRPSEPKRGADHPS